MRMLALAISIAANAFKDKLDKGGQPYILHCLFVMYNTEGNEDVKCAAVLHDLVEDTDWTYEALRQVGFSQRTIDLIRLVTFPDDCDDIQYMNQIKTLALDLDAKKIKKADLQHNSNISRIKNLTKKHFDKMERYHRAYTYLND